ncbi:MAG: M48 family metallopeptidase [Acidobacteria bacterium]|nr:M48 family metallopeptidase [Acidobacteriota bacterium]
MQVQSCQPPPPEESTQSIFARVYRQIARSSTVPVVELLVKPYVNTMGKLHLKSGVLEVRISDILAGAPTTVREALAWILLSKLFRRVPPSHWVLHYRQFMSRRDVRRTHQAVRVSRGRKYISGPQGATYNLDEIFDQLRDRYFPPLIPKPALGWSRRPSRTLLGHFDNAHNAIILSSLLDRPQVPRLVVEYVLFHEMLHLKHPVEHHGSRRRVHTSAFRADEKLFDGIAEAKELLKRL